MIKPFIDQSQDVRIGGIAGKLYQHIGDDSVHLTKEEKTILQNLQQQDSDSDGTSFDSIFVQLNNKADKDEIPTKVSQLENDLNFISEIPDYYTTEEEVKLLIKELAGSGSGEDVDLSEILDKIEDLTQLINEHGITIDQLREMIEQNSSDITDIKESISNITQQITNIDNRVTHVENIIEDGGGSGEAYVLPTATSSRLGGIKVGSGLNVENDGTLSVASSGGGEGGGGLTPGDISELDDRYLRKDQADSTQNGLGVYGNFQANEVKAPIVYSTNMVRGELGRGFFLSENDGSSLLEVDNLLVRNKASFEELEIRKISYVNGSLVLSAAGGIIESVKRQSNGDWKCYLKSDNGSIATTNSFQTNDLVRCQTFDIKAGVYEDVTNKFYWRQVVSTGTEGNKNYIVLSKTQKSSETSDDISGTPAAGDTIVQFGNTSERSRQNVILISAVDTDAPSITMYTGLYTFNLSQATVSSKISPNEVKFRSDLFKLVSGGNEYRVAIDRGEWDAGTTYYYWDRVSHGGRLWLCIYQNSEGCTGIEPGGELSTSYWVLQVDKGDNGDATNAMQLTFDENLLITAYDGIGTYLPDLTSKRIAFHVETLSGDPIGVDKIQSYTVNSDNAAVQVNKYSTNYVEITGVSLHAGESATIKITAVVETESKSTISVSGTILVMCIEQPTGENTLQAYITPTLYTDNYNIQFDENGLIESISWPQGQSYNFDLYLFRGTTLLEFSDIATTDDPSRVRVVATCNNNPVQLVDGGYGTARATIDSSSIQYGTESIPSNIKSPSYEGSSSYPKTKYSVEFNVSYAETWIHTSGNLMLNLFGQSSIFENTTSQLKSVKNSVETINGNIFTMSSTISQTSEEIELLTQKVGENTTNVGLVSVTAEKILNFVEEKNLTDGNTLASMIEQTAGDIDMSVIYNNLRMAGLNISVDEGQNTGSVTIYGDKVTIKNSEDGDNILYVQGGQTYLGNTNIVSGNIGGFTISNQNLKSSNDKGTIELSPDSIKFESKLKNDDEISFGRIWLNPTFTKYTDNLSSSYIECLEYLSYIEQPVRGDGFKSAIFVDSDKTSQFTGYGINSIPPIQTFGLSNMGGQQCLVQTLASGQTITCDMHSPYIYIRRDNASSTITLKDPEILYASSNVIKIFNCATNTMTVNSAGSEFVYVQANSAGGVEKRTNNSYTIRAGELVTFFYVQTGDALTHNWFVYSPRNVANIYGAESK